MRVPPPLVALVAVTAAFAPVAACGGGDDAPRTEAELAADGKSTYDQICAACHGRTLQGTSAGPPFLHDTYKPDHHPDATFRRAVQQGVPPHHWNFGPMPALPTLDDEEITAVIAYIRSVQREAGLLP